MLAIVDADLLLYRIGHTTNTEPEWVAKHRCNEMIETILAETGADEYQLWLSDSRENNFRFKLWNGYKANRKDVVKPVHFDFLKEYLILEWGAMIAHDMEADDACGISQEDDTVIVSIDKDLKMIPGLHYNFVKKEFDTITPQQGLINFYTQFLVGDASDKIRGCTGIGPVKARKAFEEFGECPTEGQLLDCIYELYKKQEDRKSTQEIIEHLLLIGRLLKIRTAEDEPLWRFPKSKVMEDYLALSIHQEQGEIIQSTEPIRQAASGFQSDGLPMAT